MAPLGWHGNHVLIDIKTNPSTRIFQWIISWWINRLFVFLSWLGMIILVILTHFLKTNEMSNEITEIQRNLPENCEIHSPIVTSVASSCQVFITCSQGRMSCWLPVGCAEISWPTCDIEPHIETPTRSEWWAQTALFFSPCPSSPLQLILGRCFLKDPRLTLPAGFYLLDSS